MLDLLKEARSACSFTSPVTCKGGRRPSFMWGESGWVGRRVHGPASPSSLWGPVGDQPVPTEAPGPVHMLSKGLSWCVSPQSDYAFSEPGFPPGYGGGGWLSLLFLRKYILQALRSGPISPRPQGPEPAGSLSASGLGDQLPRTRAWLITGAEAARFSLIFISVTQSTFVLSVF